MINASHLEQAERELKAEYRSGNNGPRGSYERLSHHVDINASAVDAYIMQHIDLVSKNLARCRNEEQARRVLATMVMHHLAVGAVAQRLAMEQSGLYVPRSA